MLSALVNHPAMKTLFVSGYDDEAILSHRISFRYLLRRPVGRRDFSRRRGN